MNHFTIRWIHALLLVTVLPIPLANATDTLASRRPVPDLNVMVNDDGDWSFTSLDPEESRRHVLAAVDGLAGTATRAYVRCVGAGSDTLYYPTQVASVVGWRQLTDRMADYIPKVQAGMAAGVDPIRLAGERCRELGIRYFPSVRMNDAHFARTAETHPLTGEFWMKHHERYAMDSPKNWLGFTHDEVRAYRMGIIREVIDRYADVIDGIELDFTRHPLFFPRNTGMAHADLLTEMVARTRARLDEAAAEHNRPYYLIVRVNATLETCHYSALDVERWARDGLIDVMVPAQLYDLSYDMDISTLKPICESAGVLLYATLYPRAANVHPFVRDPREADYADTTTWIPPIEHLRGAIANLRHLGAEGFETFNFRAPPGPLGYDTIRGASQEAALTMQDRVYAITTGKPQATSSPAAQLPAALNPGQTHTFTLYVGQDLADPDTPLPDYVGLRMGLHGYQQPPRLRVTINGHVLHQADAPLPLVRVTAPPPTQLAWGPEQPDGYAQWRIDRLDWLKDGENKIEVHWDASDDSRLGLHQVHLAVLYDNPFRKRL